MANELPDYCCICGCDYDACHIPGWIRRNLKEWVCPSCARHTYAPTDQEDDGDV